MPSKVIVSGIIFVMMVIMLTFVLEFFLPLSAKSDMNFSCRNALLKMELKGGLSDQTRSELLLDLANQGFTNINIIGTPYVKQGEKINLNVEVDYIYNKLSQLFMRADLTQRMVYNKTSIARKVVN